MQQPYLQILQPDSLQQTLFQLDAAVSDVITKGEAREAAYGEKAVLVRQRVQCETAITLKESEALMLVQGEGKNAVAEIDGKPFAVTNDAARDALRRHYSRAERQQLSEVQAHLAEIEVKQFRANDAWHTAMQATETVRAKASLQAALLNFLAKGMN